MRWTRLGLVPAIIHRCPREGTMKAFSDAVPHIIPLTRAAPRPAWRGKKLEEGTAAVGKSTKQMIVARSLVQ